MPSCHLEQLLDAYLDTEYEVSTLGLSLFIGRGNEVFDGILTRASVQQAVIITASNPLSHIQSDDTNRAQNLALQASIPNGLVVYHGYGRSLSHTWPPEASICVFGMPLEFADTLADRFHQIGYVVYADGMTWLRLRRAQVRAWQEAQ